MEHGLFNKSVYALCSISPTRRTVKALFRPYHRPLQKLAQWYFWLNLDVSAQQHQQDELQLFYETSPKRFYLLLTDKLHRFDQSTTTSNSTFLRSKQLKTILQSI